MRQVTPAVRLIARPAIDTVEISNHLASVGGAEWLHRFSESNPDGQDLVEVAGRVCYRSWEPGLNPNVTRVRAEQDRYLQNVLASAHGSVLEHATYSFLLTDVSRVLTHELVRHRVGTAVSQESLRFVRLEELPFWFPEWAWEDPELVGKATEMLWKMEEFQRWMADHFNLDEDGTSFGEKKHKTSFMRRFAPEGVATTIVWTANVRTLRHVIELRTAPGAEEEIRLVFNRVGEVMREELPALFGDYTVLADGQWVPGWRKV